MTLDLIDIIPCPVPTCGAQLLLHTPLILEHLTRKHRWKGPKLARWWTWFVNMQTMKTFERLTRK